MMSKTDNVPPTSNKYRNKFFPTFNPQPAEFP